MSKIQFILAISAILISTQLEAKEDGLIFGLTTNSLTAGTSIDLNFCSEQQPIRIHKEATVVIAGTKNCNSKYGSVSEKYYITGYRGKIRYIKQKDVFLTKEGEKKIDALKDENLAQMTEAAILDSNLVYESELKSLREKLNKTKSSGVAILNYQVFDESEHTEGTGYKISYYNSTKKIIKYITATIVGYNAVGDPVKSTFNRNSILILRGVGPIQPEESATFQKSYAWHTDVVESMKITSLKVEYMDGTVANIKDPRSVALDDASYEFYTSID
jgi:hypothetical protein